MHAQVPVRRRPVHVLFDLHLRLDGELLPGDALVGRGGRLDDEYEVGRRDDGVVERDREVEADHGSFRVRADQFDDYPSSAFAENLAERRYADRTSLTDAARSTQVFFTGWEESWQPGKAPREATPPSG